MILDLEDTVGFEIASIYQPNCAAKRDAIKETGAYPGLFPDEYYSLAMISSLLVGGGQTLSHVDSVYADYVAQDLGFCNRQSPNLAYQVTIFPGFEYLLVSVMRLMFGP